MTHMGDQLTDLERDALERGLARLYRGRLIPVMRGAEGQGGEGGNGGEGADGEGDGGAGAGDGGTAGESGFKPVTTQAQFDRMVQERIARERTKFADYDDLKAKAGKLDEIEAENATELEKAQKAAADAQAALEKTQAEAKETRLQAAIIAEAAKADRKVVDPEAVVALMDRSTLELGDDGAPTNIAAAMDSLLEAKPFLVAKDGGRRGDADQGARGGGSKQITEAQLNTMKPEEVEKARKEGRLDDLLGVR